ncbi:hypothetical protein LRP52_29190 [Photobacterium sp. ZSDE20]|uniref:Calcineurin-like phosphoesterase domain-containing protein n=1 Tax=Photobacterium pectinilyticum TaxID=2906793 RepID=A0ABT1N697_9GAMM|nr:hypothetical protein [Photobacterium sp. ZSDE20]MCQ1060268.1 hypothetical protein [Photobacterium sp. ZSDE20]MDD1826255.1 hypothetical protein [Photobacterium sp. ZSDE20]
MNITILSDCHLNFEICSQNDDDSFTVKPVSHYYSQSAMDLIEQNDTDVVLIGSTAHGLMPADMPILPYDKSSKIAVNSGFVTHDHLYCYINCLVDVSSMATLYVDRALSPCLLKEFRWIGHHITKDLKVIEIGKTAL